jgi:hypothetical protein
MASFWRCFSLVLVGIAVAAAIACVIGGWTTATEIGIVLIVCGVAALFVATFLGPTRARTGAGALGSPHFDGQSRTEEEESIRRMTKTPGGLLFAWLAAGMLAILVGVVFALL